MEVKFLSNKKIINKKKINSIKCPTCKKKAIKPYIPFCSKKCSDLDLIEWLIDEKQNLSFNE